VQEQQQQQQRLQLQQSLQSSESQPHQPRVLQSPTQQLPEVRSQPSQSPETPTPSVDCQHFELAQHDADAPTCQLFDVASSSSDAASSAGDVYDDAYWEAQLLEAAASETTDPSRKRPPSPRLDLSPAKRKRPG